MPLSTTTRLLNDDWLRYKQIRLRSLADAPDAYGSTLDREESWDETVWRERLSDDDAAIFVAEYDHKGDVGIVAGAPFRGRDCAGVFQMWVAPEVRGKRIGESLINTVVQWAQEMNHSRVVLEVGDTNTAAIRLYERAGFLRTGKTGCLAAPREHITEHERELKL